MNAGTVTVFLGDSLTFGNDWGKAFPQADCRNLGLNGDTLTGVWCRLDEVAALNPAVIFLQIGINNFLSGTKNSEIVSGHKRIWGELGDKAPQAKLYVLSLLPYLDSQMPGYRPNADIAAVNVVLAEEARTSGLDFVDFFAKMADGHMRLRPEYTSDGLHLSPAGYRIWEEAVRGLVPA